ncbi:hypothetical protein SAMN05880590_10176 [Rhizobium sp. RU35A]|uniref:hypothetical protein n=1 Tax=Rhizobium sp. RU35A TaxID=1907414 RepID=UPI00095670DB|nr:hypothetical protein [Rhizobium sp. RU35A]SIP89848.1 hypothetical protein SAMN05880590_10176 [Rhizobium sp. RU35A]
MIETTIKLGRKYRDTVSGFVGVATAVQMHISGPDQVCLTPIGAPSELKPDVWLDESRMEIAPHETVPERGIVDTRIILGAKYVDKVTGFLGTATAIAAYSSRPNRVCLTPDAIDQVDVKPDFWIDEVRAERSGTSVVTL